MGRGKFRNGRRPTRQLRDHRAAGRIGETVKDRIKVSHMATYVREVLVREDT